VAIALACLGGVYILLLAYAFLSHPAEVAPASPEVEAAVFAVTAPHSGSPPGRAGGEAAASAPAAVLVERRVICGHGVELWNAPVGRLWEFGSSMVEITTPEGETRIIDFVSRIDPVSGSDITGDGVPELVVERYSGGASCCLSYVVLTLGEELTSIDLPLDTPCEASFRDLDGDGIFEVIACDDVLHCRFCSCAGSPLPTVVLKYTRELGYIPASTQFPEIYDPDIPGYRARAESWSGEVFEEQDPTGRCLVLPLVLAYLYSGRASEAWAALVSRPVSGCAEEPEAIPPLSGACQHHHPFNDFEDATLARYYLFPDAEAFRAEIEEAVSKSPLFVAAPGGGEMGADMREALVAYDAAAEEPGGKQTFSIAVDLNGDGKEETIVGIGARTADKVAEFIAPGDVYVQAEQSPAATLPTEIGSEAFSCRASLPQDLLPYFFQASLVGTGDLDGDGLTEIALVWLGQRSWPLAYRPLAILQFDPLTGTYEMVTDVKRSVGEIGDYALADVDDDGRAEILEGDPVYGKVIDPTYGAEVYECHFCPHRYEIEVFEFTGAAVVTDPRFNEGGEPYTTPEKYNPDTDKLAGAFLPELVSLVRDLVHAP
jgi:hypothetical protein